MKNRELTSRKLLNISEVFYEMDKVFRQFVKGVLPIDEAKKMLSAELIDCCCADCKDKNRCLRSLGTEMADVLNNLFNIGFEKGKITILDLPPFLTSRCNRTNQVVMSINALIDQYKQYSNMMNNLDTSKVLIAEQLCGISKILKEISAEMNTPIAFDENKENRIIEDLTYKNIVCKEVAVYEQNRDICRVSVVVRNNDIENEEISTVINNVCKAKMKIENISPSKRSGLATIDYKRAPQFDVVLGLASTNKYNSEVSGDCHSLERIDDKFMLAISDGMGSGEDAEKISNLTISLVENFYKANFDSEIILSSVNKLVALGNKDNFSALDVCMLDLNSGVADFIKLGACEGYIKHKEETTVIPSGALPLGVLDQIEPKITKTALNNGDFVVLTSDGVADSFNEEESLLDFINNLKTINPQAIAENILERAVLLNSGLPKDDMTVLVCKIFA